MPSLQRSESRVKKYDMVVVVVVARKVTFLYTSFFIFLFTQKGFFTPHLTSKCSFVECLFSLENTFMKNYSNIFA